MPREIKLMLDEPYYTLLASKAEENGRAVKHQARFMMEQMLTKSRKAAPKPIRNVAGDVWDGMKFVPYAVFHEKGFED